MLRIASSALTGFLLSSAGLHSSISLLSSTLSRPWSCASQLKMATDLRHARLVEHLREVEALGLPVLDGAVLIQHFRLPDHLVERAEAERGHQLAHLLGDEEEVVDHVLGLALELGAQHRVLRGDADRAGVQVALAHHDAAGRDQRRGREAELVGAEQRADDNVAPRSHAAVDLHGDAPAQAVQHERLVRLGEADLPR